MTPPEPITYTEHAADIIARAAHLSEGARPFALITSLGIEGGAARELGSLALVEPTGTMIGYLSNGCIDRDIRENALEALRTGTPRLVRYGEGSPFVDLTLPCGGSLSVLINPAPDTEALIQARDALQRREVAELSFSAPEGSGAEAITFRYAPRPRLVLAGRGAILRAMAQAGYAAEFEIAVLSPDDEDLAALDALPLVARHGLTTPNDAPDMDMIDPHSAFLTLFHDHDWEPVLLKAALQRPAFYMGSLGSTRTHAMRLASLGDLGVSEDAARRLHGPIGLVPALRSAPLIALSTLSEIISKLPAQIRRA